MNWFELLLQRGKIDEKNIYLQS